MGCEGTTGAEREDCMNSYGGSESSWDNTPGLFEEQSPPKAEIIGNPEGFTSNGGIDTMGELFKDEESQEPQVSEDELEAALGNLDS